MKGNMKPRQADSFPKKGNHIGDRIKLPSGKVYEWIDFKRWQKVYVDDGR